MEYAQYCLRALLIHKDTKLSWALPITVTGLRALLIHKDTKRATLVATGTNGLRALLIHKDTKLKHLHTSR